jgi:hypothetical protein
MNKYIGASLYHTKEKKCSNCGMDKSKSNGCCKDEHKIIKLKREHQKTADNHDFSVSKNTVLVPVFINYFQVSITSTAREYALIHSPPDMPKQNLYIFNCVFLI